MNPQVIYNPYIESKTAKHEVQEKTQSHSVA